jgi:hypothetical protein
MNLFVVCQNESIPSQDLDAGHRDLDLLDQHIGSVGRRRSPGRADRL